MKMKSVAPKRTELITATRFLIERGVSQKQVDEWVAKSTSLDPKHLRLKFPEVYEGAVWELLTVPQKQDLQAIWDAEMFASIPRRYLLKSVSNDT